MTVKELFNFIKGVRPGFAFTDAQLTVWLNEIEGHVQTDIWLLEPAVDETQTGLVEYDSTIDPETGEMVDANHELLVPFPWNKLYRYFLLMSIDLANGEYQRYANSYELFNEAYEEYAGWYAQHVSPANGDAITRGYYISAYQFAARGGYTGTEKEFYEELAHVGEAVESGERAEAAADAAEGFADEAHAWANGGETGVPSETNNAKFFSGESEDAAHISERYAKGTENGEDAAQGTIGWHDNAKFYKEQAEAVARSIPPDYSSLAEEVSDIQILINGETAIDLDSLAANTNFEPEGSLIIGTIAGDGTWTVSSVQTNYQSVQVLLDENWGSVFVTAQASRVAFISFITERMTANPANKSAAPLAESGRHRIEAGASATVDIPSGATYMVVTYRSLGNNHAPSYVAGREDGSVDERLNTAEHDIAELKYKSKYIDIIEVKQPITIRSYIENGGDIGTVVTVTSVYNANFRHAIIHVTAGDEFIIHGRGVSDGSAVAWALTDESYILLDKSAASTTNADYTVTASSDGYLITNGDTTHYVKKMESLAETIDVNSIRPEVIYVDCHETDWNNTEYTSRDGLLESTPLATIAAGLALNPRVLVVMDGEYNEALSMTKMTGITICMNQRIRYSAPSGADNRTAYPKGDIVISRFNLTSCNDITLENIHISGSTGNYGMYAERCDNLILTRCICEGNTKPAAPGFRFDLTNVKLYGCIAHDNGSTNGADGFNFHGGSGRTGGHSEMYNCVAYNNGDDGISHHEYCTGYISGGEFYNNQKGGIASPVGGAFIDIENVRCFNNGYGIYAYGDANYVHPGEYDPDGDGVTEYTGMRARISNSVLSPNINNDITLSQGKVILWNSVYDPNRVSGGASLVDLTPAYTALVNQ